MKEENLKDILKSLIISVHHFEQCGGDFNINKCVKCNEYNKCRYAHILLLKLQDNWVDR